MRGWKLTFCVGLVEAVSFASVAFADRDQAQSRLAAAITDARDRAQEAGTLLRKDAGALWGTPLEEIPWFFVSGSQVFLTIDPNVDGYQPVDGLWSGPLPQGVSPANTSIEWAGQKWAMVMLPLPTEHLKAQQLLIHEVWHVVQPKVLPLPRFSEAGSGAALLDAPEGRIWLQLEWRALAKALTSKGDEQEQAVRSALLFRGRRYFYASQDERDRERLLDLSEGLAEYTGRKLSGAKPSDFAATLERNAPGTESYVRAFAYFTGPAYGFLLDQRKPRWIRDLKTSLNLQELIATTVSKDREAILAWLKGSGRTEELVQLSNSAGRPLGLLALEKNEAARWRERQQRLAELKARFVDGPTLRLRPGKLRITFNPSRQVSLGDAGTVMSNFGWKDADGSELSAPKGALVTVDWKEIRVPLLGADVKEGSLEGPMEWTASDWTLTLQAGWRIDRDGNSMVATPPKATSGKEQRRK